MIEDPKPPSRPPESASREPGQTGISVKAAWITTIFAFFLFVILAWIVRRVETAALEAQWLLAFRSPERPAEPLGPGWLEETVRDFTALGSHGVLVTLVFAATVFLLLTHRRRQAMVLALAYGSGIVANHLLKLALARPRPDVVEHLTTVYTASFPSGHAMLSTIVSLTLAMVLLRGQATPATQHLAYGFAASLALLVGVSRVYLGVHWPTDVLAGWAFGLAWALLFWQLDARLQRSGSGGP